MKDEDKDPLEETRIVHAGGRPSKLETLGEESRERLLSYFRQGAHVETAAAAAGISKQTFHNWLKQGARDIEAGEESIFAKFVHEVEQARAQGEVLALALINRAARQEWRAAAWRLERQYPERYGRRDTVALEGDPDRPVAVGLVVKLVPSNKTDADGRIIEAEAKEVTE